jgi:hypothetical protein
MTKEVDLELLKKESDQEPKDNGYLIIVPKVLEYIYRKYKAMFKSQSQLFKYIYSNSYTKTLVLTII